MNVLKVSTTTDPAATAGAIANGVRLDGSAEIQVIGPKAVNQAVKAIAIARGYLAASGIDLYCVPSFTTIRVEGDEEERTGIHFCVFPRRDLRAPTPRVLDG